MVMSQRSLRSLDLKIPSASLRSASGLTRAHCARFKGWRLHGLAEPFRISLG